jgi:hypothetical protein
MERTPIPDGPNDSAPQPLSLTRAHAVAVLTDALKTAGVELGAYDRLILNWLAMWEGSTVLTVASWVTRAHHT